MERNVKKEGRETVLIYVSRKSKGRILSRGKEVRFIRKMNRKKKGGPVLILFGTAHKVTKDEKECPVANSASYLKVKKCNS